MLKLGFGGECMFYKFQFFLQDTGIISQHSCPSTPQQNGIVERWNPYLLSMMRTLYTNLQFFLL